MNIKTSVGFGIEVVAFYIAGFLLLINKIYSIILFSIAVGFAIYVGRLIKKEAIEEYKKQNAISN